MSVAADAHELARFAQPAAALGRPGAPPGGAEASGLDPAEILRIIKQRKGLVIISFVVLYLIVGAVTFVVHKWFPAFDAEAILELSPPREAFVIEDTLAQPAMMELQLETEANKLKQLSLLQDVLKQPEIKDTNFYRWYEGNFEECLFDLQEMVSATPIRDTELIRVSFSCGDAEEARLIVDTIITRYLDRYGISQRDEFNQRLETLKQTQSMLAADQANKRREIAAFRATTDIPSLRSERTVLEENIAYLTKAISELEAQAADYQAQLDSIAGLTARELPVTPEMQVIVEADPILRFYRQQVEVMDVEIETARRRLLGDKHRGLETQKERRRGYSEKEAAKREELIDTLRARQLETYRQNLARTRSMQARLQEQLGTASAEQRDLSRNIQKFTEMLADEERIGQQLAEIDEMVTQAMHAMRDRSRVRLSIVQRPVLAAEPSRPNLLLFLGGGFALALMGGFGLAFLREFTDKAIRTPIDVIRHGQVSVLGAIPQLDDEEADIDQIELATRKAPQSLVAEAYRQVRANLLFSGPAESQRALLITSPGAGDGKTATAINLAVTLAQGNQRVLLVDCNFRRPAIRGAFPNTKSDGLSNVLIGQAKLEDVITKTDLPNLHVVSSGPTPPTPGELLGSPYMREVIKLATEQFDRVIFDGPPVLLISDALVLATQVDGVILVARAVDNSKGELKRAREQFERVNARVIGAVVNGVEARPGGYYKQQYRDFYDYVADETIPQDLGGLLTEGPEKRDEDREDKSG